MLRVGEVYALGNTPPVWDDIPEDGSEGGDLPRSPNKGLADWVGGGEVVTGLWAFLPMGNL